MAFPVLFIVNSMIRKALLPDGKFGLETIREFPLYKLNCAFQRQIVRGRDEKVQMIGHYHEFMQEIFLLRAIIEQSV